MSYTTDKHDIAEETISMRIANRKAKDDRESQLRALEAFANLGETPEDWKRFRLKYPDFFPDRLSKWFYGYAEVWAKEIPEVKEALKPPLLFYRNLLRAVWTCDDDEGLNLKGLLGFELERGRKGGLERPVMPGRFFRNRKGKWSVGIFIPGQPADPELQTTIGGLPPGRPIVNGVTGGIDWKFGCMFQQSVYDLMQQRWRSKVCPECGKFLLADKTRQIYCSSACFGDTKRKRSLAYWNSKGSAERDKRRATKRRKS